MKKILSILLSVCLLISFIPIFTVPASAAGTSSDAVISVEDAYGKPGSEVVVELVIKNNPGILGMTLKLNYDESKATLISVENGDALSHMTFTTPRNLQSGCQLPWDAEFVADDDTIDGVIATLTFKIAETANINEYVAVSLSYDDGAIIDRDMAPLSITLDNGTIQVLDYTPGDLHEDGLINTTDVVYLRRFVAGGYGVDINENAADVNDDSIINTTDAVYIRRYVAGGYGVRLKPVTPKCAHTMEEIPYKAATCTEDGNISYWHCTSCGKYFNDSNGTTELSLESTVLKATGHTAVTDPAVDPTYTSVGWTEGSHCSVCGEILVAQQEIPMLQKNEYYIYYHFTENDLYLQQLDSEGKISNENPSTYTDGESITLLNLSVTGYTFEGWYDGPGSSAEQIKKIENQTGTIHLYAHWTQNQYYVQFDAPLVPVEKQSFTVNTGLTLRDPDELPGYVFMGWSDADGNLVSQIPVGTAENLTLYGNWTSARNQTRPKTDLGSPVIYLDEDNQQILFAYEIGTIDNIPLSELKYIGNIMAGIEITESVTTAVTINEGSAREITEALSNATTNTSAWTLSNEWTSTSSVSESHLNEMDSSVSSNIGAAYSASGTFNVSTSRGGSTTTAVEDGVSGKISAKSSKEASVGFPIEAVKVGAKVSTEISGEVGKEHTTSKSDTTTWNTNAGYSASRQASLNASVSRTLAQKISDSVTYNVSKAATESTSRSQSTASTSTNSREYASSFTYSTAQMEEKTYTVSLKNAPAGYYRMVCAGRAHVFAVVTYDMATRSYGIYTYSIMEDEVRPFLDYSKESSSFDDNENGVLPFEVPFYVYDYVQSIVGASDGLIVDPETGIIEGYTGSDQIVVVPQYLTIEDGVGEPTVVKIQGFTSTAFAGNTDIKAVQFSDFITEIPDNAFNGCSSLVIVQAPAATKIGANAFAGCVSLKDYSVSSAVTSLGANAFTSVNKVTVDAANETVADAAVNSGAKNIVLNLDKLSGTISGKRYTISGETESFTFNGGSKTYNDVRIISDANTTVIKDATFYDSAETPLVFSSPNVTLNKITVSAPSIALKLTADSAAVGLFGTVNVNSRGPHAAVCKNVQFYWSSSSATGKINLTGNMLVSGTVEGESNVSFTSGQIIYIDDENPVIVTFDPNEGTVEETSRLVYGGTAIGELPVPTRDYYTFNGWFTSPEGGEQVTADTLVATDVTVYASWTQNPVSEWTLASEVPADAEIIAQKWSYTETTNTESRETTLDGYTKTGSYWVKSGSGTVNYSTAFPSGFDTGHTIYKTFNKSALSASETETSKREVSNAWAGYVYWHWMYDCGGANGTANRAIYNKKGNGPDNGFYYQYFGAFTSTNGNYNSDTGYCNSLGIRNYIVTGRTAYADCQGATRWFRFDYYTSTYTDYYKMFQYQKIENKESITEVVASDTISNVQEWVQYRAK